MNNVTDICRTPGKFEGEPNYVQDYWEQTLEGREDETIYDGETPCSVFFLDDSDRQRLDLDTTDYALVLWESDQGFVNSSIMTEPIYTRFVDECASEEEEDN